jgi:hypothetical protein
METYSRSTTALKKRLKSNLKVEEILQLTPKRFSEIEFEILVDCFRLKYRAEHNSIQCLILENQLLV